MQTHEIPIARMLVKVVEKQLKLHKHEAIQLERSEAVDTELAVVALGHTNSIGHASGRMGVMAGDIKDTQDNTEILAMDSRGFASLLCPIKN